MKRILFTVIFSLILWGSLFAQADLQPAAIVRLTGTEPISVGQLKKEIENTLRAQYAQQLGRNLSAAELAQAMQGLSLSDRKQALDLMINQRLILQAATRDRITVPTAEVNQQIQQYRAALSQQAGGRQVSDEEFAEAIRSQTGLDMNGFRDQVQRQLVLQKYISSKKADVLAGVRAPSDAEIQSFYNLRRNQFMRDDTIRFSFINVAFGADAATKASAKALADSLRRDIGTSSARFDETIDRGQLPGANFQSGRDRYLPRNAQTEAAVGTIFINTAFSLPQGQISPVIEGTQGFQIIKITENYEAKLLALTDIVQPGSRVTVRDYITEGLTQQNQQAVLAQAYQEIVDELRRGNPFQIFENTLNW